MAGPPIVLEEVHARYGRAVRALHGVSLEVREGQFVALLGANGAGKTTVARAVTGLLAVHGGTVTAGRVLVNGREVRGMPAAQVIRGGLGLVMEGRRIFADLTVEENLVAGATGLGRRRTRTRIDQMMALFPQLAQRAGGPGGNLSGGEQQMLAIARALMRSPRVLVLDEPSLGLAPTIVDRVAATLVELSRTGVTILLVEQSAALGTRLAQYCYVLDHGRVAWSGTAAALRDTQDVPSLYLGGPQ